MFDEKYEEIVDICCWDGTPLRIKIRFPDVCPVCHKQVYPKFIYGHFDSTDRNGITCLFSCSCGNIFMSKYENEHYDNAARYIGSVPDGFDEIEFSDGISKLSPNFVKIYNQAAHAETLDLNLICGMGYRKAIEYLVKDFCVSKSPADKDKILGENLASSVNRLDNPGLHDLAKACKDLGNDETHVIVKYDEGLPELKNYISGLISYIELDLLVQHAHQIYSK